MQHTVEVERVQQRKTPLPVRTDERAAFAVRMHMGRRGLTSGGLADEMLLAGITDAPSRQTIDRIIGENAVPRRRHQRALAEFFFGPDKADPTRIWKVRRRPPV